MTSRHPGSPGGGHLPGTNYLTTWVDPGWVQRVYYNGAWSLILSRVLSSVTVKWCVTALLLDVIIEQMMQLRGVGFSFPESVAGREKQRRS